MFQNSRELLHDLCTNVPTMHQKAANDIFLEVHANLKFAEEQTIFTDPINKIESIISKHISSFSFEEQQTIRVTFLAKMGLNLIELLDRSDLPQSIIELYPEAFTQFINHINNSKLDCYCPSDDFYCKDIKFFLGLSLPCGAQYVEIARKLRLNSIIFSFLRSGELYPAWLYIKERGYGYWLGIHTDTRNLKDFNEAGWDECYKRIAELLERKMHIRGMFGTSWFYDPNLLEISPRLAYLQQRPLERGAFRLKHGTSAIDIERATLTSKTRARLYNDGKYMPRVYSIVWPRKELLAWAQRA